MKPQGSGPPLDEDPEFLAGLEALDPPSAFSARPAAPPLPFLRAEPPRFHERHDSTPSPSAAAVSLAPHEAFYGFNQPPFGLLPDPRFIYRSASYERALHELVDAVARLDGLMLLMGGEGTGKTTLCRSLAEALGRRTVMAFVSDGPKTAEDVLKAALVEFGIVSRGARAGGRPAAAGHDELARAARAFAASLAPLQASALMVVDDAHLLPDESLARLCALPGPSSGEGRLQLLLVGEPSLASRVQPGGPQMFGEQPTATLCRLGPLGREEIGAYVAHRLAVAGAGARAEFSAGAVRELYLRSRGVPRLVNELCDRALEEGAERSAGVIGARLVAEAGAELGLLPSASRLQSMGMTLVLVMALVGLMLAGASVAVRIFRDDVSRIVVEWQTIPPPPDSPALPRSAPLAPIPPPE